MLGAAGFCRCFNRNSPAGCTPTCGNTSASAPLSHPFAPSVARLHPSEYQVQASCVGQPRGLGCHRHASRMRPSGGVSVPIHLLTATFERSHRTRAKSKRWRCDASHLTPPLPAGQSGKLHAPPQIAPGSPRVLRCNTTSVQTICVATSILCATSLQHHKRPTHLRGNTTTSDTAKPATVNHGKQISM
jgi:hypothetical protein